MSLPFYFITYMDAHTPTPVENEDPTAELASEEEDLSSGNGRLAIIVGVVLAVVVLGYMLLPAQATRRIAQAMPIMELGEANVTATRPREEAAPAASETKEATAETEAKAVPTDKPRATAAAVAAPAAPFEEAAEPTSLTPAEEVAIEPVPTAPATPEAAPATVTLSGRVLDENGRPLAGATVMVKGHRTGTGTDANGNYKLEVPAGDNTVVYGYGGYEDQEIRARGSQPQNVTLVPREDAPRRRRR